MSLTIAKIVLAGANNVTGNAGAYFQLANIVVNTAGSGLNITIPAGIYYANTPSNCSVYANLGANTVVLGANTAGLILSDGVNVFANTTTNGTLTLVTVNGGNAVSGTFTS